MTSRVRLLLGGAFDPVHIGHMRLALECQARFYASELRFIPAFQSPLKAEHSAANEHRLHMVQLAAAELNRVTASDCFTVDAREIMRGGTSYTVDSLQALRETFSEDCLVWIMGLDSWLSLPNWHRWQALTDYCHLLVANRPGYELQLPEALANFTQGKVCAPESLPQTSAGSISFINTTPLEVSSTAIRHQLGSDTNSAFLVCEPVRAYINQHQLYRTEP